MSKSRAAFEAFLEDDRRNYARWCQTFPPVERPPIPSDRYALLKQRTPRWADREAIRCVYAECLLTSRRTGVKHHVDHVIPLVSANVSGLHVAENLQVIPATENLAKHNRFRPIDGPMAPTTY